VSCAVNRCCSSVEKIKSTSHRFKRSRFSFSFKPHIELHIRTYAEKDSVTTSPSTSLHHTSRKPKPTCQTQSGTLKTTTLLQRWRLLPRRACMQMRTQTRMSRWVWCAYKLLEYVIYTDSLLLRVRNASPVINE
jgi:hypothetical protein